MTEKTRYGGMRRFRIDRAQDPTGVSGTGCVAQGVVFSDGTTVVRWMSGTTPTTTLHDAIESVENIHLHGGMSKLRWEDPICFACAATLVGPDVKFCDACGARWVGDPHNETRANPALGAWAKALTIEDSRD